MKTTQRNFCVLCVLLIGLTSQTFAGDWVYQTKPGDTLWDLCLEYTHKRGCWIELGKYNKIGDDRTIQPGQIIRIPSQWLIKPPIVGRVLATNGQVTYQTVQAADSQPLTVGQELELGATLLSTEGSATLLLGDDVKLLLRPHSSLFLDSLSGASSKRLSGQVGMQQGSTDVEVNPAGKADFRIVTPSAIAAVRGTQYRVDATANSTRSEVLSGSVAVDAAAASTLVAAGFGTQAHQGKPPEAPRQLLAAPEMTGNYRELALPATLRWSDNDDAHHWLMDLFDTQSDPQLLQTLSSNSAQLTLNHLNSGCYRALLRGVDSDGFQGLNAQQAFCVVDRLPAPQQAALAQQTPNDKLQLSWPQVEGANSYRVELSPADDFKQILYTQSSTQTNLQLDWPPQQPFSLRLIAIDKAGNESTPSAVQHYQPPVELPWDLIGFITTVLLTLL